MVKFSTPIELQNAAADLRCEGKTIGFVPTMGALHHGHLSLVQTARKHCDIVVVSLFVNPTQFGPNEDFDAYPRDVDADCKLLEKEGVDWVFTPNSDNIYPTGKHWATTVYVPEISKKYCGASRPDFFGGICMVVNRLFNITQCTHAYFGEKDFQQLVIIQTMVRDLFMPINVIGCPTKREEDGLASSSRNTYLSADDRRKATQIYQGLLAAKHLVKSGIVESKSVLEKAKTVIEDHSEIKTDYFVAVDATSLTEKTKLEPNDRLLYAGWLNGVRLIDNIAL